MNPNPRALRILCYGDSNTWGAKPDGTGRFAADVRWTGRLQILLGEGCEVIEEGLGGRTTDLDQAGSPGRNGAASLPPRLDSHRPLDAVVLMLGTNDLKAEYKRSAEDIARAVANLAETIKRTAQTSSGTATHILIVSPPLVDDQARYFAQVYAPLFNTSSLRESHRLATVLKDTARKRGHAFLDAAPIARSGEDGVHLEADAHVALAEAVATELRRAKEPRGIFKLLKLLRR